jgi:SAM-dependent methyltransferase
MWPFNRPFGRNHRLRNERFFDRIHRRLFGLPFLFSKGELSQRLIRDLHGKRLLEIGCRSGIWSTDFALRGAQVTGVDLFAEHLGEHARSLAIESPPMQFLQADTLHLPFPSESFDVVVIFDCLEHIEDDEAVMREIVRVLRPGGRLFLTVPTKPGHPPHRVFTRLISLLPKSMLRHARVRDTVIDTDASDGVDIAHAEESEILRAFGHWRHYSAEDMEALIGRTPCLRLVRITPYQRLFESEAVCFHLSVRGFRRRAMYPFLRLMAALDMLLPRRYPGVQIFVYAERVEADSPALSPSRAPSPSRAGPPG